MDFKDKLKKIKVLLGMEIALATAKLKDGTEITFDELAEGKEVFIVTAEGNVPAPAGEHTLEDETVITIDETGKITKITKPEEKPEEEVEEVPVAMEIDETRIAAIEEAIAMLTTKLDEILAKLETPSAEVTEMKTQLSEQKEQIEKLLKEPVVQPAMFRVAEEKQLTADEKRIKAMNELQKK